MTTQTQSSHAQAEATRPDERTTTTARAKRYPAPAAARRILIALAFPTILMPLLSSSARVALPIVRQDFQIQADMVAWVDVAFSLPFMVLMPIYGRLSDGVGRRRLMLAGISIFIIGSGMTVFSPNLTWLMVGRAIQGVGVSGIMPLSMALLSAIFPPGERGKALGTWSSIGPAVAFVGPLIAGTIIDGWGWRMAFLPPFVLGFLALVAVYKGVPSGLSNVRPNFLRTFDWTGTVLLSLSLTNLLFYLSSRPITGVAPLRDWRLLVSTVLLVVGFVIWEQRHADPFVNLKIYRNTIFRRATIAGMMRMFVMAGIGFLIPLYLTDVYGYNASQIGAMVMIPAGAMSLIVRFGGQVADRWGSRWPTVIGISIQTSVVLIFGLLPATTSGWVIAGVLVYYGLGAGFVLAALHRAAMGPISDKQMGMAAGLYSMGRFFGMTIGSALGGVVLQHTLDLNMAAIDAYQITFLFFAAFAVLGIIAGFGLYETKTSGATQATDKAA